MPDAVISMPTQCPDRRSRCFYGAAINIGMLRLHVREAHFGRRAA
jgi:hypothetical protein